jgi:hypothetical protein
MKLKGTSYFDIFWVIFFGCIFVTALTYDIEAGLLPLLVSGLCLLFSIIRLMTVLIGREKKGKPEEAIATVIHDKGEGVSKVLASPKKKKERVDPRIAWKRFFIISSWLLGFAVGVYLFGHLIAIPLFTFLYLRSRKEKWVISIVFAVMMTVGVYLVIVAGAKTPLYQGVLVSHLVGE